MWRYTEREVVCQNIIVPRFVQVFSPSSYRVALNYVRFCEVPFGHDGAVISRHWAIIGNWTLRRYNGDKKIMTRDITNTFQAVRTFRETKVARGMKSTWSFCSHFDTCNRRVFVKTSYIQYVSLFECVSKCAVPFNKRHTLGCILFLLFFSLFLSLPYWNNSELLMRLP